MTGSEYANAIYENDVDAALAFLGVARNMMKYSDNLDQCTIENVYNSVQDGGRGIYVGTPGFTLVLTSCNGECHSPVWN